MREIKFKSIDNDSRMQKIMQIDSTKYRQFTGLLDKNGKEIYEGDIIQEYLKHYNSSEISKGIVGEVWFNSQGMFVYGKKEQNFGENFLSDAIYEIIGNIYENPELIKN